MTFKLDWWWPLQEEINSQFGFSKVRENVASKIVSSFGNFSKSLDSSFTNRDFVLVGAGLSDVPDISKENLIVYCLSEYRYRKFERGISLFDKNIKINFKKNKLILSEKDKKNYTISEFKKKIGSL